MLKIILLGWIAGIAMMGRSIDLSLWFYLSCGGCIVLWGYYLLNREKLAAHVSFKATLGLCSLVFVFCLGYQYADDALEKRLKRVERVSQDVSEIIYIQNIGERTEKGIKQPAQIVTSTKNSATWLLYFPQHLLDEKTLSSGSLLLGQYYRVTGKRMPVQSYANAGGFDQEKWFIQQNWMATLQVRSIEPLTEQNVAEQGSLSFVRQQHNMWLSFNQCVEQLRLDYREELQQLPLKNKALMLALLTGDRSLLATSTESLFQRFGISHLLAISGPHVLVLALIVSGALAKIIQFLKPTLYLKYPRPIFIIIPFLLCVFIYTAFVGFEIPAMRTLFTVTFASFLLYFKQRLRASSLLIYCASLSLWLDPFSILSAAFWLSYGASYILLNIYQQIPRSSLPLTGLERFNYAAYGLIQSQWKIFVALLPLVLIFFQQLSWIAPIANLIAIPLLGAVIVPIGVLAALLWLIIPTIGRGLFQLNDVLMSNLLGILNGLDALFEPKLHSIAMTPLMLLGFALGIVILFLPKRVLPKSWVVLCIATLFFTAWLKTDTQLSIIDVGQGQAIFVKTPEQKFLIDTGGSAQEERFSMGKQVVVPYLSRQGVARLDQIILSHLDQDHSGALDSILSQISVPKIMANEHLPSSKVTDFSRCQAGQTWQTPALRMQVLSPTIADDQFIREHRNETSCVIHLEFLQAEQWRHFLIMGDAGWETEFYLLQHYPDLKVDVLVLGHHGSKHSSSYDFLRYYRPKLAIASVGRFNRYGHPSTELQARLQALNIPFYTTVNSGTITFRLDRNQMELEQFRTQFKWLNRDHPSE